MKKLFLTVSFLILISLLYAIYYLGFSSLNDYPISIRSEKITPKNEIDFLYKSDQKDRQKMLLTFIFWDDDKEYQES